MAKEQEIPDGADVAAFRRLVSVAAVREASWPSTASGAMMYKHGLTVRGRSSASVTRVPVEKIDGAKLAAYRHQITKHPVFVWLSRGESFQRAITAFVAKRQSARKGPLVSPFAEFRFLQLVATHIWLFYKREAKGAHPSPANRAFLLKGLARVRKLQQSVRAGATLPQWEDHKRLDELLAALEFHLEVQSAAGTRGRADEKWPQRRFVASMTEIIFDAFGVAPTGVITALAGCIEYEPDPASMRKQIGAAIKRYKRKEKRKV